MCVQTLTCFYFQNSYREFIKFRLDLHLIKNTKIIVWSKVALFRFLPWMKSRNVRNLKRQFLKLLFFLVLNLNGRILDRIKRVYDLNICQYFFKTMGKLFFLNIILTKITWIYYDNIEIKVFMLKTRNIRKTTFTLVVE